MKGYDLLNEIRGRNKGQQPEKLHGFRIEDEESEEEKQVLGSGLTGISVFPCLRPVTDIRDSLPVGTPSAPPT